jgi:hypothetical protein
MKSLWSGYYTDLNYHFEEIMVLIGVSPVHVAILGGNVAACLADSFRGCIIGLRAS